MDQYRQGISIASSASGATSASQCEGETPQMLACLLTRLPGVGMDSHPTQSQPCSSDAALPAQSDWTRSQDCRERPLGKIVVGRHESRGRRSSHHREQGPDLSAGNGSCDCGGLVLCSVTL